MEASPATEPQQDASERIVRHALADRLFHWVTAAAVLTLLGTAFLPILGIQFAWVTAHWIAGLVLLAAVLFHTVRALFWQNLRSMWIGRADLRDCAAVAGWSFRWTDTPPPKPGKYSLAQKLVHHSFSLVLLATIATGLPMLLRIDTPWWRRNPYSLAESTWGVIYFVHGLAALILITIVMVHVYFALRPEKLAFTRAMIVGWITRAEYREHHDPERWQVSRDR